jgi:hypothetical protein
MEREIIPSEDNELEVKKQELLDSSVHLFLTEYQKVIRGEKTKTLLSALDYIPGREITKSKALLKRKPKITESRREVHKLFLEILGEDFSGGLMQRIKKEPPRETANLRGFAVGNPGKTLDVDQTQFYIRSSSSHFYLLTIDSYLEPTQSTLMAEVWEIRRIINSNVDYEKTEAVAENTTNAVIVYNPKQLPGRIRNERKTS